VHIKSLGYAGIFATDISEWQSFATSILGMQVQSTASGLALRIDDAAQRLLVHADDREGLTYLGWEVENEAALQSAARHLESHGIRVHRPQPDEVESRHVVDMLWFQDPLGNRVELFHGLAKADRPFEPARPSGGFRTGALGLGHAVLTVPRIDDALPFYRDVLGFKLSDYALRPFHAVFLHVNARHHSLALIETGQAGLHHLMVEALSVDDLGKAYDAALEHRCVNVTLGRHTNDHVLSFYARSPSKFMFEYGWGGRSIDDATWTVEEMVHGPSLWGHERSWLSDEQRAEARRLRLRAAAAGQRAPVHVAPGEYDEAARG
jgi:2,3-dihydroxybiphenyl 1,2-dioxygenase